MNSFNTNDLKQLYKPGNGSHKGQNGKLMIIGGSKLFHGASLWALQVASRIVDMVFYSSVPENNQIVQKLKEEFRNGIIVPRDKLHHYIEEADCILIGPGLPRLEGMESGDDDTKKLTERLLKEYSHKKWVIDGGSLQVIEPGIIPQNAILTPHHQELETLKFKVQSSRLAAKRAKFKVAIQNLKLEEQMELFSKEFHCIVLLKGQADIICSPVECVQVKGGNPGMTKGGTGDVLAGLVAALACKNNPFLAAKAGSYINKKAGDSLYEKVGPYFNASDLADEIPKVMKELIIG
ncbi:MAG: NAD(P)H-hydrate dehydratase [Candidatus Levybacteria bacterium]|nr:NAD(P)H-hydrate dehydratase [Candidatus Levybacteria bacterium]